MAMRSLGLRPSSISFTLRHSQSFHIASKEAFCLHLNDKKESNELSWKWRLLLSYDGTNYAGWQLQRNPVTVQYMLEESLTKATRLTRDHLSLIAASRTDAGVHAWGQVAEFQTNFPLEDLESLHKSLNAMLPQDIRIREVAAAKTEFHVRYSALKKLYQYKVYCDPVMDPLQHRYALHVPHKLNIEVMKEAAKEFLGSHDFASFANASKEIQPRDYIRKIYRFDIIKKGPEFIFEVEGSGFFYKQVRNMVGLILEIGKELLPPRIVSRVLQSQSRTMLAGYAPTSPPHGLSLMWISYDEMQLQPPVGSPKTSYGLLKMSRKCKL